MDLLCLVAPVLLGLIGIVSVGMFGFILLTLLFSNMGKEMKHINGEENN